MGPSGDRPTRALRLTAEQIGRFADASGDRNPLHVDHLFARTTPYGHCIAHGALVCIAALGSVDPETLRHTTRLDIEFRQPVFPGEPYTIWCAEGGNGPARVEVARGGQLAAVMAVTADRGGPTLPRAAPDPITLPAASPRRYTLEELAAEGMSASERYACRVDALAALASELDAGAVPELLLIWLSAASFTIGMLIPGRNALFARARLTRSVDESGGTLAASVRMTDERTGLVVVEARLADGERSASMQLHAFVRAAVPEPDRASIGRYLAPSAALRGQNVVVVGASRGFGAALSGALATQEATVWGMFARCRDKAERLAAEFGTDRIRLLQVDAENVTECREAFDVVRGQAGRLDGICLCAAPALNDSSLHPDAMDATLHFVSSSVAKALVPLAGALQLLSTEGWVVLTSSCALADPPERWPQLILAKAALEGAAAYCARHSPARVLILRPPKMWTDGTNTPLGRIGALPTEQVAAGVVRRLTSEEPPSRLAVLTPEQLVQ